MSDYIRHLSLQLTVHPTLPALLTKTRPTEDQISYLLFKKNEFQITKDLLPIQSLRIRWNRSSPKTSNHSLYLTRLIYDPRYPERNFAGLEFKHNKGGVSLAGSPGTGIPGSEPPTYATHSPIEVQAREDKHIAEALHKQYSPLVHASPERNTQSRTSPAYFTQQPDQGH
jgi:hypothetical protein